MPDSRITLAVVALLEEGFSPCTTPMADEAD